MHIRNTAIILLPLCLAACSSSVEEEESTVNPLTSEQCITCHTGIEAVHEAIPADTCTICHGGDGQALDKEHAHVPVPDDYWTIRGTSEYGAAGFIKDFRPDQLDRLDPDYLRFINPGDIRVAAQTCGQCHQEQVASQPTSIMTTNAGHYMPTLYYGGFQGQDALYGSYGARDAQCGGDRPEGSVCELTPLIPPGEDDIDEALLSSDTSEIENIAYKHYLSKNCNTCHAAGYGKNNASYLYRSTGCTSCHMIYNRDGVYQGNDEAMPRGWPVYPDKHVLTTKIPSQQCATCHFQGGRIGLLFRGIREGGFSDQLPPNAETWNESAYGHVAGYYVLDEDTTNDWDETPPDIHYQAGMDCVDCHVGTDVHGDGRIYSTSKYQVDIRCEDCHGNIRRAASPDADGIFRTPSGRPLPQLFVDESGAVALKTRVDEKILQVPQPALILASGKASDAMKAAMAPDEKDWSHADSLTCDTCHNSYQEFCIGCHVTVDYRSVQKDGQTGQSSIGLTSGSRSTYSLDHILLSQGVDGRAQATMPSQQVQMTIVNGDGDVVLGKRLDDGSMLGVFRSNELSDAQVGFAPFNQHTITNKGRACETCHRVSDDEDEYRRVRGVYGFGTGEFMLDNPKGEPVDALQFLDEDGRQIVQFAHPGTGPLAPEVIERALSVKVQ